MLDELVTCPICGGKDCFFVKELNVEVSTFEGKKIKAVFECRSCGAQINNCLNSSDKMSEILIKLGFLKAPKSILQEQLAPCYLCGCNVPKISKSYDFAEAWQVECPKCGLRTSRIFGKKAKRGAIRFWNRMNYAIENFCGDGYDGEFDRDAD